MEYLPPEIISKLGTFIKGDKDFKSCLATSKQFKSILYNYECVNILCQNNSILTYNKINTILKHQPNLEDICIQINSQVTNDELEQIAEVLNYICSLEQIKEVEIRFFTSIDFDKFFKENNYCNKCTITMILSLFKNTNNIEKINLPQKEFNKINLYINNHWYNACKHLFKDCNIITFTKFKTDDIMTISFEDVVDSIKTQVFIYSEDILLLIKGSKCVKTFYCYDTIIYSWQLETIENFYKDNPLNNLDEIVLNKIDLNLSCKQSFYLYKLLPYIKAEKYAFIPQYHLNILPFLEKLNTSFNIDYNNIYLINFTTDEYIISQLCKIIINKNININKEIKTLDNNNIRYSGLQINPNIIIDSSKIKDILNSTDIKYLFSLIEDNNLKYIWSPINMVVKNI